MTLQSVGVLSSQQRSPRTATRSSPKSLAWLVVFSLLPLMDINAAAARSDGSDASLEPLLMTAWCAADGPLDGIAPHLERFVNNGKKRDANNAESRSQSHQNPTSVTVVITSTVTVTETWPPQQYPTIFEFNHQSQQSIDSETYNEIIPGLVCAVWRMGSLCLGLIWHYILSPIHETFAFVFQVLIWFPICALITWVLVKPFWLCLHVVSWALPAATFLATITLLGVAFGYALASISSIIFGTNPAYPGGGTYPKTARRSLAMPSRKGSGTLPRDALDRRPLLLSPIQQEHSGYDGPNAAKVDRLDPLSQAIAGEKGLTRWQQRQESGTGYKLREVEVKDSP
ncbi:hypothetical protein EV182_002967 [Spiromyces aspiralis]|uniref:Uncharacterized protein n=1 Tax=Spiromyces aspiralis TaxID=68401 RepID=A0ACC1HRS0_9FUNG|nr:hypothetical protein EV182_002967 [Spiromyces aspiralis]